MKATMGSMLALFIFLHVLYCDGFCLVPVRKIHSSGSKQKSSSGTYRYSQQNLRVGFIENIFSKPSKSATLNSRSLDPYYKRVENINALEKEIEKLTDEELMKFTDRFRKQIQIDRSKILDNILEEAFAVVREAAWRVLELRHFDVQLVGGMILHECKFAEIATGEGKTLVATLPAYLNALSGEGSVFIVTANDYLARRDSETMGQIFRSLGLTVGLIQAGMSPAEKRMAYECDITYVTHQELGFDYLRDNLAVSSSTVTQVKKWNYCLVDEADSILIDEARTPLIISKQVPAPKQKFAISSKVANVLQKGLHYSVREKEQMIIMTDKGYSDTEKMLGKSMFDAVDPWAAYIINAIKAKELFSKDKDYITADKKVQIVDSFSGRILEGRKYSDGLHQSIEAKEGIEVSTQGKVIAQVTYQSLFGLFPKLAGMSGTAFTDAIELETIYGLNVVRVPTALPLARRDYPDAVYKSKEGSIKAILREIQLQREESNRPILVGTTSVEMTERIANELAQLDISCEVLNAKPGFIEREAEIIAQAGRQRRVTVATNMAGRGTDILLGGNAAEMARLKLRDVVADQCLSDEERSIVPVTSVDFFSCELSADAESLLQRAVQSLDESKPLSAAALDILVSRAAESTKSNDIAIILLQEAFMKIKSEYSNSLQEEKEAVKNAGGLYVMGTSRHESRRIDNQLRGRAGRQGDPGASRFFLSLDDDLFRVFGGEKAKEIMNAFRLSDDLPIESKAVTEALDKVQRIAEAYFASIRRSVLEYDQVLNSQRDALYRTRREFLLADDIKSDELAIKYFCETVAEIIPNFIGATKNPSGLVEKMKQFFPSAPAGILNESQLEELDGEELKKRCNLIAIEAWKAKKAELDKVRPGLAIETVRYLFVTQLDDQWCEHLDRMSLLKESVSMEVFRGNDPLREYKDQSLQLFEDVLATARRNAMYSTLLYNPRPS